MNNEELQKKILNTIEDKCIEPKSNAYFVVKNILLWSALVALVVITALSIALAIFHISNGGYFKGNMMLLGRVLLNIFLIGLVVHYLKSMRCAYRKSVLHWIILAATVVSVIGVVAFMSRIHQHIDRVVGKMHPALSVEMSLESHWTQPQEYRLSGTMVRKIMEMEHEYELRDFKGRTWVLDSSHAVEPTEKILTRIEQVRVIGFVENDVFMVCAGAPWKPKGMAQPKSRMRESDVFSEIMLSDDPQTMPVPIPLERYRERNLDALRSNMCQ